MFEVDADALSGIAIEDHDDELTAICQEIKSRLRAFFKVSEARAAGELVIKRLPDRVVQMRDIGRVSAWDIIKDEVGVTPYGYVVYGEWTIREDLIDILSNLKTANKAARRIRKKFST